MSPVTQIANGVRGFDTNSPVGLEDARALYEKGFRFAIRYIPRITQRPHDITAEEVQRLHDAGLAFMPVQHVESDSDWVPSFTKGQEYGDGAVKACKRLALPAGTNVWLDLEGVRPGTLISTVVVYCQHWFGRVAEAGWRPGLYVGWRCGMSARDLYYRLSFQHYWGAYNLNTDEYPVVRGIQMRQYAARANDRPAASALLLDVNIVREDRKGNRPYAWAPEGFVQ